MNTVSKALYADLKKARSEDTAQYRFGVRAITKKGKVSKMPSSVTMKRDEGTREEAEAAVERLTKNNPGTEFVVIQLW